MAAPAAMEHLSTEELGRRYRAARDRVERRHLQVIWLLREGYGAGEVTRVMGDSARWVAEIVRRHHAQGPEGLVDRRHGNAGAKPLLSETQQVALAEALQAPPPQGGLWSGPKVAAWIAAQSGRKIRPQRGWDYLLKLGFTLPHPRPRHAQADAAAQAAFKKGAACRHGWPRFKRRIPRLGARPGRWMSTDSASSRYHGACGASAASERVHAPVHHRYRRLYLYGFVHPASGRVLWYLMPTINAATFGQVLAAFAADAGAGPGKEILLVLDGAGWHVAKELAMPNHLHPVFLPPDSPALQPTERLWPLANEAVANRCVEDLAALGEALAPHGLALARQPDLIRGHTLFRWWPQPKTAEEFSRI